MSNFMIENQIINLMDTTSIIQVIDTIYTKHFVNDTTNIANADMVELYKVLLQTESANHYNLLLILLAIVGVIFGLQWWWNKTGANSYIKKEVEKKIEGKKGEWIKEIERKVVEKQKLKIAEIEFEIYRSFAYSLIENGAKTNGIFFTAFALDKLLLFERENEFVSILTGVILTILKDLEDKKVHNINLVKEIIEKIPETLKKEKDEIFDLLNNCENV